MKQQVTRRFIQEALHTLLQEKPMDKITVRDIVEECGLTRNTFYYHYDDIFDLFEDFLKTQLSRALHASPAEMSPEELLLCSIGFLLEKPQVARNIFSSKSREVMLQYFERVTELLLERQLTLENLSCTPEDRDLILAVCSHAIYGTVGQWLLLRKDALLETDLHRIMVLFEGTIHNALIAGAAHPRTTEGQRT